MPSSKKGSLVLRQGVSLMLATASMPRFQNTLADYRVGVGVRTRVKAYLTPTVLKALLSSRGGTDRYSVGISVFRGAATLLANYYLQWPIVFQMTGS